MRIFLFLAFIPISVFSNSDDYINQLIYALKMDVIAPKMMKQHIEQFKPHVKEEALPCLNRLANDSASINEITHSVYSEIFGQNGARELVEYLRSDIGKNLELLTFKKITVEEFNSRMSPEQREIMNRINAKYFNRENQSKQKELFRAKGDVLIRSTLQKCVKSG